VHELRRDYLIDGLLKQAGLARSTLLLELDSAKRTPCSHHRAGLKRWQASSDQLRFDDTGDGMRVVVELFKDSVDIFQ